METCTTTGTGQLHERDPHCPRALTGKPGNVSCSFTSIDVEKDSKIIQNIQKSSQPCVEYILLSPIPDIDQTKLYKQLYPTGALGRFPWVESKDITEYGPSVR